jgi:AcrR family transcriptional regulator
MSTRVEQREKTRQSIVAAALELASEQGLGALSLREVTRRAGVAPATFYRYFIDMDDLALALVDHVSFSLRQLMRQTRHRVKLTGSVVRTSVETLMQFIEQNPQLFRILLADRSGSPKVFQDALQKEKQIFIDELADDLSREGPRPAPPLAHIPLVAEMMIHIVFDGSARAVDMGRAERKALTDKLVLELKIVVAGSRAMAARNHHDISHSTTPDQKPDQPDPQH